MKKTLFALAVFLSLTAAALHAQQMNLDDAIDRSAREVEEALPQGSMVAVLNFASPSETFSDYVIEELTGRLVMGRRVTIVDRSNLALIRGEMHLQLSGDVSDESAQAIGRMLGAQAIVSGTLTSMGTFHRFRARVISVETAAILTQVSLDLQNDAQVAFLLGGSAPPVSRQESAISDQSAKTANAVNSWISGEINILGIGARYERMLNSNISLGVNAYWLANTFTDVELLAMNYFTLDSFFRFYPWGKAFFAGISLGFSYLNSSYEEFGVAITPEIGWKIDIGNPGKFFLQPGMAMPFRPGNTNLFNVDYDAEYFSMIIIGRLYFGVGYAF